MADSNPNLNTPLPGGRTLWYSASTGQLYSHHTTPVYHSTAPAYHSYSTPYWPYASQTRYTHNTPLPSTPTTPIPSIDPAISQAPKAMWKYRRWPEKICLVLKTISNDCNRTLGDFLYHLFRLGDQNGAKISRPQPHAQMVVAYLRRQCKYRLCELLADFLCRPDGRPTNAAEHSDIYTITKPYFKIGAGPPTFTAFAVQKWNSL